MQRLQEILSKLWVENVPIIRKAVAAFSGTLIVLLGNDFFDGHDGVTKEEFLAYVGSSLAAAGLVWRIPNARPSKR
jgi:hypothetical protein